MQRVKVRTFSGVVCEQEVYLVSDRAAREGRLDIGRERFRDEAERVAHREAMARRRNAQLINANFSPTSLYSTLTFDVAHEVHDFDEARRVRRSFVRRLKYRYPDAVIYIVMGRGLTTGRIHFHMISEGISAETIAKAWRCGSVKRIEHLRANCRYNGVDHGPDYTGLANYLFDHWTVEQGGHHYYISRGARAPEREEALPCKRAYSADKPPVMRGYKLVEVKATKYGYLYFKYVREPKKRPCGRPPKVRE